jgi:hypothetical protein
VIVAKYSSRAFADRACDLFASDYPDVRFRVTYDVTSEPWPYVILQTLSVVA